MPNMLVQLPVVNWAARLGRLALCGTALHGVVWHSMARHSKPQHAPQDALGPWGQT